MSSFFFYDYYLYATKISLIKKEKQFLYVVFHSNFCVIKDIFILKFLLHGCIFISALL